MITEKTRRNPLTYYGILLGILFIITPDCADSALYTSIRASWQILFKYTHSSWDTREEDENESQEE